MSKSTEPALIGFDDPDVAVPAPTNVAYTTIFAPSGPGATFKVTGRGVVGDTVTLYDNTTAVGTAIVGADGKWSLTTTSLDGDVRLKAKESDGDGDTSSASRTHLIAIAASTTPVTVTFVGTAGKDQFNGGGDNAVFKFTDANLTAADVVFGGGGPRTKLLMTTPGTVDAEHVEGVGLYELADGGANTLVLTNANFGSRSLIAVNGGDDGNTVDASAVTGGRKLVVMVGGAGTDHFIGGAYNEFGFTTATLSAADTVVGGPGNNELFVSNAGTVNVEGVSGVDNYVFEFYGMAGMVGDNLTLTDSNFAGMTGDTITVSGSDVGMTVDASALSGNNEVVLVGRAQYSRVENSFTVAQHAVMTGGLDGTNSYIFTTPGTVDAPDTNQITNFGAGFSDAIFVSEAGFDLGSSPNEATLFTSNSTGSFTTPDQRFAYDTSTGQLFYDSQGSAGGTSQLVVTLTGAPALSSIDFTA